MIKILLVFRDGPAGGVDAIHRAATRIQAASRGLWLRSQWEWGIFVKPYRNSSLIPDDVERDARDEMLYPRAAT